MRFIGNKKRLVEWIYSALQEENVKGEIFFDFFSGTSNVGKFFKEKNYRIISSDILYFSYVLQRAYLVNNTQPKFKTLLSKLNVIPSSLFPKSLDLVIDYLNNLLPTEGFIYNNYSPAGTKALSQPRMFFIDENAKKIDAIRIQIEQWKTEELINENEYFVLLACLIEAVPFFANIMGVFAAFKKDWDKRALKSFVLKPIESLISNKKHLAFNQSSIELLNKFSYDIIYLDPPYNQRQYAPNYHLLETIAKYDNPEIKGISGMRNYDNQKSTFCNKEKALSDLELILESNSYKHLVLSYNNEGIMPHNAIFQLMSKYGKLKIKEYDYLRFKSNSKGESKNKKIIKEQLFILTK